MKQNISVEDIQQLTDNQKDKLRKLWEPAWGDIFVCTTEYMGNDNFHLLVDNVYVVNTYFNNTIIPIASDIQCNKENCLPILSIGQMIEILEKYDPCINITRRVELTTSNKWVWEFIIRERYYREEPELCDVLWQAIKDNILKEE